MALLASSLGMMIAPNWGARIWVFVIWGLLIGQICSQRFHSDINLWAVFRQLPFSGKEIVLAEIASSVIGAILLCWFAFGLSSLLGFQPNLPVVVLAPGVILCITLAAVFDILRQSKSDALMAGHTADTGAAGLIVGLIVAGVPLLLCVWISSQMITILILWVSIFLGLFLSLGIAFVMWQLTGSQIKKIK